MLLVCALNGQCLGLCAHPKAHADARKGHWVFNDCDRPYPRSGVLHHANANTTCAADASWKYTWIQSPPILSCLQSGSLPGRLHTGVELCDHLPQTMRLILAGDSLTGQLATSWEARLKESGITECMPRKDPTKQDKRGLEEVFWGVSSGPQIKHIQIFNWVISDSGASTFLAGDVVDNNCGERMRKDPASFGIDEVMTSQEFVDKFNGATHIVFNEFAHVAKIIWSAVEKCYDDEHEAVRKVLQWWRVQMRAKARAFASTRARVFYRTSPPAGDRFIGPNHPQTAPLNIENARSSGDEKGPPDLTYSDILENYGSDEAVDDDDDSGDIQRSSHYFHDIVEELNAMGKEEFRAAGHGVVDLEDMIGVRQDGHPASLTGVGDKLHYCMPGVPDYSLEATLDQMLC